MGGTEHDRSERVGVVLSVLGQCLAPSAADELAEALPAPLARSLRGVHHVGAFELEELIVRVAERAELGHAGAAALIDFAFGSIARELTPAARSALRQALPASIAAGFPTTEPEEEEEPSIWRAPQRAPRDTLAEGRPGSHHPLSEAHPERAQSQSVVRASNPHGEEKLSSAHGLTQEREEETLATGRPGSQHPLSERSS